jgi:hypothetical protein
MVKSKALSDTKNYEFRKENWRNHNGLVGSYYESWKSEAPTTKNWIHVGIVLIMILIIYLGYSSLNSAMKDIDDIDANIEK